MIFRLLRRKRFKSISGGIFAVLFLINFLTAASEEGNIASKSTNILTSSTEFTCANSYLVNFNKTEKDYPTLLKNDFSISKNLFPSKYNLEFKYFDSFIAKDFADSMNFQFFISSHFSTST
jgi:hypothetical protein